MRLCIDPGHGGSDPGGTGYGKQEKNIVLDISYAMMHQATALVTIFLTAACSLATGLIVGVIVAVVK